MPKHIKKIPSYSHGFTLVELMITVAIFGILLSVGLPSFKQTIANGRLTTHINRLVTALNYARSEAVKRNQTVTVRKIGVVSADWSDGWTIFVDLNGNGLKDGANDTLLKQYEAVPENYTLKASGVNQVIYRPSGMSGSSSFILCDDSDDNNPLKANTSRLMLINTVGRVRMGSDTDGDGIQEKSAGTEITQC